MSPLAQAVVLLCLVALTVALVIAIVALRRTVQRAESVLAVVEREIRPMATQLEALAEELRGLSRQATRELERVSTVVRRVEDVSLAVVRIAGAVSTATRLGRVVGAAMGLRRGLDVVASRLRRRS
jgi:uncharacterized protein YoxC